MKRYTATENLISAILGIGIGLMVIPFMIAERQGRNEAEVKHYVITSEPQISEVTETTEEVIEPAEVVEASETSQEEPYFPYTQEDVYLVGNTVFHEVGVLRYRCTEEEAMKALKMTASAVVNRAKMNYMYLGRKISDQVIESQYASFEKISNTRQEDVDEIFYQIAEEILQNGPVISERLVFQSEFKQGQEVAHIDNQYFGIVPESESEAYKNAE